MKKPITTSFRYDNKPLTGVVIDLPFGRHTTHVKLGNWNIELKSYKIWANENYPVKLLPHDVSFKAVVKKNKKTAIETLMYEICFVGDAKDKKTALLIKYIDQVSEFHEALQIKKKRAWNKVSTSEWVFSPEKYIEKSLFKKFGPKSVKREEPKVIKIEEPVEEFNGDVTDHIHHGC